MNTHESEENYLETILMLEKSGDPVRSIDIAHELDYSRPSISVAMKHLRESGYIVVDEEGHITLTDSGREIAQSVYNRHTLFTDWLLYLGVDRETAVHDACRMEHGMSEKSYTAIRNHVEEWKQGVYKRKPE